MNGGDRKNLVRLNTDGSLDCSLDAGVSSDVQYIELIPGTKHNKVTVFSRWGDIVFDTQDYDNVNRVFRGLNNNGNELPSGTYFYKMEFEGAQPETGFIELKR